MQTEPTWDDLRILLAVHRGKSFLAAGKALGMATSTVARRIAALERALDRTVVHRGNAGTVIDADALELVALGERVELGLHALARGSATGRVEGTVRVSAPEGIVRQLTRVLARLHVKHPGLAIEVVSESRMTDIARHEADVGVRIARSSSVAIVEKRLGRAHLALFAARSYVERRLPSARLGRDAAAGHDWVGLDRSLARLPSERWMREYGATRFVLRSPSAAAVEEALLAGMGLGVQAVGHGVALDLVRIETESLPPPLDVYLAYHRDARKTPRVRVVVRELETELRRALV
ncbi:MAG: LysR family transcriptional regulator [Sandaracinaceae bacterium]